ncbi:type VI secretion system tip protein VgrG [Lampropedia aestuarii]|uniref:Type VI secretion system tip protein VgrG n=1 Tax=Lampropedia aestuarii TaxID=2562762 RepID=A0A4S5BLH4_9BURK|nr:type VI secretion system tip protein TssI/VgrG [Lampropedia aestuarii]THJ31581.1 type VI secretion system tip protein VgrG [Lampropedia aestuarii]
MNRFLVAHTPLGQDLWAYSLKGREALSSLYEFTVGFKSKDANIDCQALIGEVAGIELEAQNGVRRYFSGQMVRFAALGKRGKHWLYEAKLAPKLWHAGRQSDFKIWQRKTVQDIADEILGKNAIKYEWRIKQNLKNWEYKVQYGETDLAFLTRQLEHEGIYYWFEHSQAGETLVLADHFSTPEPFGGYESIPFYPPDEAREDEDHYWDWQMAREPEPGKLSHSDYDFKKPSTNLATESNDPRGHLFDQYEIYQYPGNYTEPADGSQYASARLEAWQAAQDRIILRGKVRGATPGYRFGLWRHPRNDQNRDLLIVSARYEAEDNDYESRGDSQGVHFFVEVEAQPADRGYRPHTAVQAPRARGPETAVVVGPAGEEIYTDEYGRVKVHFHWDRYGAKDGTDSCWIRVASPWAGSNYGAIQIPRIGQEVIVDYEYGDPDRPLVTGRVYNAEQMPPWELPRHKTQSGFQTNWSKGGGGKHMLRFEDLKGVEHIELSTDHGNTHLHMGYLMNQSTTASRSYGFELRTNEWGAIRADKGLLITTYTQDFTQKVAHENPDGFMGLGSGLAATESLMQEANNAVQMMDSAITALNELKASHVQQMADGVMKSVGKTAAAASISKVAQALSAFATGAGAAPEATLPKNTDPAMPQARSLQNLSKDISKPVVSIVSPEGQSLISPKAIVISSGQSVSTHAQDNITLSANAQLTQLAKTGMLTHVSGGGQRNTVSEGDIASEALTGHMNLTAQQNITMASLDADASVVAKQNVNVQSVDDSVLVHAGKHIRLEAGESITLVVGGSTITMTADGNITVAGTGTGVVQFDKELAQFGGPILLNC